MNDKDAYHQHLTSKIAGLEDQLADAKAALNSYLEFKSSSSLKTPVTFAPEISNVENEMDGLNRKGLRGSGRTRDVFEFLYKKFEGATVNETSKATGYPPKDIAQFYHRYLEDGLLERSGEKMVISSKGRMLVDKSQPYTGDNPAVVSNVMKLIG